MKLLSRIILIIVGGIVGFLLAFYVKYCSLPIVIVGEQLGSIADLIGAVGTIGAVIVALFTSKNDRKPNLSFYCKPKKNTFGFTLNVQNNSNEMVCLVPLSEKSQRYILWPVGTSEKKEKNDTISTLNAATLVPSSTRIIEETFPKNGEKLFEYYDTISKCYYEVVIESSDSVPSVLTYSSFYWKWLR